MESSAQTATESSASPDTAKGPFYYVEYQTSGATFNTTLNEMPVDQVGSAAGSFFASPVNVNLIGEGNELRVIAGPAIKTDSTGVTAPDDAEFVGAVKLYEAGDTFGTADGEIVAEFNLRDTIEARREELRRQFQRRLEEAPATQKKVLLDQQEELTSVSFPVEMTVRFDSPATPSFRARLKESPVITDTSRLKDYAMKLGKLIKQQNTQNLWREFSDKESDYNKSEYKEAGYSSFSNIMDQYYKSGLMKTFDREEIGLRKKQDGRVWEIYVKNDIDDQPWKPSGRPFLKTKGIDGKIFSMPILVSKVNGELKVVRSGVSRWGDAVWM